MVICGYGGRNNLGILGDGTTVDKNTPVQIVSNISWKSIAQFNLNTVAINPSTVAIKSDGTLWVWGNNLWYDFITVPSPYIILTPTHYKSNTWICVGGSPNGSYGIQTNGDLYKFFQSGGAVLQSTKAKWKLVDGFGQYVQKTDGTWWSIKNMTQIDNAIDWKYLMGNGTSVISMKSDGSIYTWGNNKYFDLGLGKTFELKILIPTQIGKDKDWKIVAKFYNNPLVQKIDGSLWAWGQSSSGQSGCGINYDLFTPSLVNLSKN